jgi:hypothetical protein
LRGALRSQINVLSVATSGTARIATPSSSTHELFVRLANSRITSSSTATPIQMAARYRHVRLPNLRLLGAALTLHPLPLKPPPCHVWAALCII